MAVDLVKQLAQDALDFHARDTVPPHELTVLIHLAREHTATRVGERLIRILEAARDLLMQCAAHRPHGDTICGRWFVKATAHQIYCTSACASRMATQRARQR